MLNNFKIHFLLAASFGFFDELFHRPCAHAATARIGRDAHRRKPTRPTAAGDHRQANDLVIAHEHAAGGQVNAIAADHGVHDRFGDVNGDKIALKTAGHQVREEGDRVFVCRFKRECHDYLLYRIGSTSRFFSSFFLRSRA